MRIPNNTIYMTRLKTYGTLGLKMDGVHEEPGCPRLYKAKYVDGGITEPQAGNMAYGSLLHDALFLAEHENLPLLPDALDAAWNRLDVSLDFGLFKEAQQDLIKYLDRADDGLATLAVERHFTAPLCEIDGEQYYYGGYVDKLEIDPDDPYTIYVRDYKTNRQPPSQADLDNDNQFTMYLALVRANLSMFMPDVDPTQVRFVGIMDAIKWYALRTEREHWELDQFEDFMRVMARRIHNDNEGLPVLNPSCSWCPIKFDCPAFNALPGSGTTIADRMSKTTDLEQRVYFMREAEQTIKALKSAVDAVKLELLERADKEPVEIGDVRYYAGESWTTDWDLPKLYEMLGDKFFSVIGVTAYKVDALAKRDPVLKDELERVKTRYPRTKPQLKMEAVEKGGE